MLILSTLIIIPILDSLICITEDATAHSVEVINSDFLTSSLGEVDEHCNHDHCHHNLNIFVSFHSPKSFSKLNINYQLPENDVFTSHFPLGSERPPRA